MNHMINNLLTALNYVGETFCQHAAGVFVQSALLVIVLFAVDLLLRKRIRAVFRYCVWLLVLVKLILPPSLSLPTGVGYWAGDHLPSALNVSSRPFDTPGLERAGASGERLHGGPSDDLTEGDPLVAATNARLTALTWKAILFILWLVGVLAFLALLVQRARFVRALIAASMPAKEVHVELLEECRQPIGVRFNSRLRISDAIPSPAVCGFFRPTIVIPTALVDKLSPEGLRAILIHELAHIKRGDLWVNSIQTFLQIVYFYNPFVWLANSIIRKVCEEAVDETVLVALGGQAKDYSNTLIDIGEMAFWRADLGLRLIGVAESRKALQWRIKHMLNRPIPKSSKLGALGIIVIFTTAAVLLPMARAQKPSKDIEPTAAVNEGKPAKSLHQAARDGDIEQVKKLIAQGTDVNARDENGDTALGIAVSYPSRAMVKLLISKGADIDVKDGRGFTPLHWAIFNEDEGLAQLLVSEGADIKVKDIRDWTFLQWSIAMGQMKLTEQLITKGANIHARDNEGCTPLHHAESTEVVELLLAEGADINTLNNSGETPLDLAAMATSFTGLPQDEMVRLLITRGGKANTVHFAARIGDLSKVKAFTEEEGDVNAKNSRGAALLHAAVLGGHKEVVELLIAKGSNVNINSPYPRTPLHVAAGAGHKDVVEILLTNGADVHAKARYGRGPLTPLHRAASGGHEDVVRLLISKGADVNANIGTSWTPLHEAAGAGRKGVVKLLVAEGADANAITASRGLTPLHRAAGGHKEVVELLIAKSAEVNAKTRYGWTPLHIAASDGCKDVVELLIARGAGINAKDNQGGTPLWYANDKGHTEIVALLRKHGAKE